MNVTDTELITLAAEARQHAYAPYSRFKVGAALRLKDGRTICGANIENISFGLTMCAERVAVGTAILAGSVEFELLALSSDSTEPIVPCGACRQVLAEFQPSLRIISSTVGGSLAEFSLSRLLPSSRQGILEAFHVEHV